MAENNKDKSWLQSVFNMKSGGKKASTLLLGAALLTGGTFVSQEISKDEVGGWAEVERIETITDKVCAETVSIKTQMERVRIPTGKEGEPPVFEQRQQTKETTKGRECNSERRYIIHTDEGTFVNEDSYLQGKFNSEAIQEQFWEGGRYEMTTFNSQPFSEYANILTAEETDYSKETLRPRMEQERNGGRDNDDANSTYWGWGYDY